MRTFLVAALVACGSSAPTVAPGRAEDAAANPDPTMNQALELVVTIQTDSPSAGKPLPIAIALVNRSAAPVVVNRRLLVGTGHVVGELALDVRGDDGDVFPFQVKINAGKPGAEHFTALGPGERAAVRVDLADHYGVRAPGSYTVIARYRNADARGWVGELASTPVVLAVAGGAGPIGEVEMLADGTLVLDLRRPAWVQKRIAPSSPEHAETIAHVGAMKPGDRRAVPPWPDAIDDAAIERAVALHVAKTRAWQGDEWTSEITGTDADGNARVTISHRDDRAAPAPGAGKSFVLVVSTDGQSVVRELRFQ